MEKRHKLNHLYSKWGLGECDQAILIHIGDPSPRPQYDDRVTIASTAVGQFAGLF
ncbi:hypothetical protein M407DRAFT_245340, partial [Tulasnella calospora MUT 4182]